MNKSEIIRTLAKDRCISISDARKAVNRFLDLIAVGLNRDNKVSLHGFGTFYIEESKAMKPPKKRKPRFKVGTELNMAVN